MRTSSAWVKPLHLRKFFPNDFSDCGRSQTRLFNSKLLLQSLINQSLITFPGLLRQGAESPDDLVVEENSNPCFTLFSDYRTSFPFGKIIFLSHKHAPLWVQVCERNMIFPKGKEVR